MGSGIHAHLIRFSIRLFVGSAYLHSKAGSGPIKGMDKHELGSSQPCSARDMHFSQNHEVKPTIIFSAWRMHVCWRYEVARQRDVKPVGIGM